MEVFKLNEHAELPVFATKGSACFDLKACLSKETRIRAFSPHNKEMLLPVKEGNGKIYFQAQPGFRILVPTGLIFDVPERHVLKLFIRSSMAIKYGLTLANDVGIVDSDYVEETFISIINVGDTPVTIYHGDRIAQGRLEKNVAVYDLTETLERPAKKTNRTGGIGSTGVAEVTV